MKLNEFKASFHKFQQLFNKGVAYIQVLHLLTAYDCLRWLQAQQLLTKTFKITPHRISVRPPHAIMI